MATQLTITLSQLEGLLDEQKQLVIERLLHNSYQYNAENTPGQSNSLKIDREAFEKVGAQARYPAAIGILRTYIKD